MVQEIVQLWEKNKNILKQHIAEKLHETHEKSVYWRGEPEQEQWTYKLLVQMIVRDILNGGESGHRYSSKILWDETQIHEIFGGYGQGTLFYIIPCSLDMKYIYTRVSYGSCSLCDTLIHILDSQSLYRLTGRYLEELNSETPPGSYSQFFFKYEKEYYEFESKQVDDLMTLSLHIVQRMRWLYEEDEEWYQDAKEPVKRDPAETDDDEADLIEICDDEIGADDWEDELFDPDETGQDEPDPETYPETID
jgi:hypothetical protein